MKKLLFALMLFVAASFASCGNSSKSVDNIDSTMVDTIQLDTTMDTVVVDTLA